MATSTIPMSIASGSSYIRFPDGTQIVWGVGTIPNGAWGNTWQWSAVPFKDTNYAVNITMIQNTSTPLNAASLTKSLDGFTINRITSTGDTTVNYIAIGKWK